jgi:hypothetical protein
MPDGATIVEDDIQVEAALSAFDLEDDVRLIDAKSE